MTDIQALIERLRSGHFYIEDATDAAQMLTKADALAEAVRAYPTYISTAIRRALTAYGEK